MGVYMFARLTWTIVLLSKAKVACGCDLIRDNEVRFKL